MKLIHYGCSFAMGNGIPYFIKGLPAEVAPKLHWKTAVMITVFQLFLQSLPLFQDPSAQLDVLDHSQNLP